MHLVARKAVGNREGSHALSVDHAQAAQRADEDAAGQLLHREHVVVGESVALAEGAEAAALVAQRESARAGREPQPAARVVGQVGDPVVGEPGLIVDRLQLVVAQ